MTETYTKPETDSVSPFKTLVRLRDNVFRALEKKKEKKLKKYA
jgi:hypothetical protein